MIDARVPFANGSLEVSELAAAFAAFPGDITFVDAEGIVRYFSECRIFTRPAECLGRPVLDCHSESTRPGIARMLSEFATGWRDEAIFLESKHDRDVHVRYVAVRAPDGTYLGCLESATWADPQTS